MAEPRRLETAVRASSEEPDPVGLGAAVQAVRELAPLVGDGRLTRIRVTVGSVRLEIDTTATPAAQPVGALPVGAPPPPTVGAGTPGPTATPTEAAAPAGFEVRAPLVGVFYRRPAPNEPLFVAVGDRVEVGQQLAIVEAMKMMNAIVADRPGVVGRIHADDGDVVEFDQPLLTITPC